MTDEQFLEENRRMYAAMNETFTTLSDRLAKVEAGVASIQATMAAMPRHPVPCETACDLIRRLTILETRVEEHHRRSDDDERIRKMAGWKVFAAVMASLITGAGAAVLATHKAVQP